MSTSECLHLKITDFINNIDRRITLEKMHERINLPRNFIGSA